MDAPNTKFAWSKFERVLFTRPVGANHMDVVSNLTARQFNCIEFDAHNLMMLLNDVKVVAGGRKICLEQIFTPAPKG